MIHALTVTNNESKPIPSIRRKMVVIAYSSKSPSRCSSPALSFPALTGPTPPCPPPLCSNLLQPTTQLLGPSMRGFASHQSPIIVILSATSISKLLETPLTVFAICSVCIMLFATGEL